MVTLNVPRRIATGGKGRWQTMVLPGVARIQDNGKSGRIWRSSVRKHRVRVFRHGIGPTPPTTYTTQPNVLFDAS